jgi:virulence-associated protein VagC
MSVTAKLFQFGNSQAVRIPARLRFEGVQEVEVVRRGDELVLRPAVKDAAELFARIRAKHGLLDIQRSPQGDADPVAPLDL